MEEKHVFFPTQPRLNVKALQKFSDLLIKATDEVKTIHDKPKHDSKYNLIQTMRS